MNLDQVKQFRRTERRHMIAVKNALGRGLDLAAAGESVGMDFYCACAEYLDFIMARFHAQGAANIERLRPLIDETDTEGQAILADTETMLADSQAAVTALLKAKVQLVERGADRVEGFEEAGRAYIDFYDTAFARRKDPAQQIIEKYFDPQEYWLLTNDVTDDCVERERSLYNTVGATAPDGMNLTDD